MLRTLISLLVGIFATIAIACASALNATSGDIKSVTVSRDLSDERISHRVFSSLVWERTLVTRYFCWTNSTRAADLQHDPQMIDDAMHLLLVAIGDQASCSGKTTQPASTPVRKTAVPTVLVHDRCGWPVRTMASTFLITANSIEAEGCMFLEANSLANHKWLSQRALPLRPIWPSFGLSALCSWAGIFFLWEGCIRARAIYRRLGGRCPRCGYLLRANLSRTCSECGWRRKDAPPEETAS
jgi:hypothetical protein